MSIPTTIPYGLGGPATSSGLYTTTGFAYSYAIGGLPFLSAASRDTPIVRQTAPFRKQQFDSSEEPGEQSLEGWWLRSQRSFHGGAGQLYNDANSGDVDYSPIRYFDSSLVDVWTPGTLKLLHGTTRTSTKSLKQLTLAGNGVPFAVNVTDNNIMFFVDPSSPVTDTNPSAKTLQSTASSATKYYVSAQDGIWERLHSAGMGTAWTKIWNITVDQVSVIKFVKQRLVLADADGVYELASGGPGLPALKWTAPAGGWTPIGIAESSNSIYVAGRTDKGFILQFTLDTAGTMPTLASGRVVVELPHGELINQIFGYLGRFLAIGTTLGARVARIQPDGSLELGPLLWEFPTDGWAAKGTFLYAGVYNAAEQTEFLYRVDLSTEFSNLRFAYATDVTGTANTSIPTGVTLFPTGSRLIVISAQGAWYENTTFAASGFLQTSRIRFGTLEPKLYKFVRVRGPVLAAGLVVSIIEDDGTETTVIGYGSGAQPGVEDADIPSIGPNEFVSLKFTLSNASAGAATAEMGAYQLKALPATPRRRQIRLPLYCFDWEKDRSGIVLGGDGTAVDRIIALENLDSKADVVYLQDLDRSTVERAVIEDVEFVQIAPPDSYRGWGGIINLTVRTV